MVDRVIVPNPVRPIVETNNTQNQEMRTWTQRVTDRTTITGTGSPEGVVDAKAGATYYDLNGTTGTFHYAKKQDDISGDTTKGWILA